MPDQHYIKKISGKFGVGRTVDPGFTINRPGGVKKFAVDLGPVNQAIEKKKPTKPKK